jgi:hypothetical protein
MDKRRIITGHYQENMFGDLMDREDYFHKLPNISNRRQLEEPKTKVFYVKEESNWENESQELLDEKGNSIYEVYNLTDCPEDATIHRGLFSAYDYIEAVRYGIQLARQGVMEIKVEDYNKDKTDFVEEANTVTPDNNEIDDNELEDLFSLD